MKGKALNSILTAGTIALASLVPLSSPTVAQNTDKYFCGTSNDGVPTTYARTATGKRIALIRWQRAWGGLTLQERCEAVSKNFQKAHRDGALKYLVVGQKNSYEIVCAMKEIDFPTGESCDHQLFTVRKGENAEAVVKQIREAGSLAGSTPLVQTEGWSVYELQGVFLEDQ